MDDTRPTQSGTIYPTPEAGPLTPPSMQDHFARPASGGPAAEGVSTPEATVTQASARPGASAQSGAGGQKSERERTPEDAAQELGERLKPVLDVAEDVATKALDVTAKGLSKLVDKLEERRRHRDSSDTPESS